MNPAVNKQIMDVPKTIRQYQTAKENRNLSVDGLSKPSDATSRQIMDLVVADATITDCLFFVDKGFYKVKLMLNDYLK
jgi:hypothetical protein